MQSACHDAATCTPPYCEKGGTYIVEGVQVCVCLALVSVKNCLLFLFHLLYTLCLRVVYLVPLSNTCQQNPAVMSRVGQNRICTPYMTVYLVISLPKILFIHRIRMCMALANPSCESCSSFKQQSAQSQPWPAAMSQLR